MPINKHLSSINQPLRARSRQYDIMTGMFGWYPYDKLADILAYNQKMIATWRGFFIFNEWLKH